MFVELLFLAAVGLFAYAYYKWTINLEYFKQRNVKHHKPTLLLPNKGSIFSNRLSSAEFSQLLYNDFPDEPIYGRFDFRGPIYVLRDPQLIKQIGIKDFDHFQDHRAPDNDMPDPLFGNGLIMMIGDKWRRMRATLSPAFTGSKMRQMFDLITECADDNVNHFVEKTTKGQPIDAEMRDFFTKYTNDVIASCAFGIKVNSTADPDNAFFVNGSRLVNVFDFRGFLRIMIMNISPTIARYFGVTFFDATTSKFFHKIVLETMEIRKQKNIHRPDMIDILMKVRDGSWKQAADAKIEKTQEGFATAEESNIGKASISYDWTEDELIAQCFVFFFAGFESSSTVLQFLAYELARNLDIQQRLYEEVLETEGKAQGSQVTYDAIQKMKYMDQVVCEALRKWPPFVNFDRCCVKDYNFDYDGKNFKMETGRMLLLPMFGIHHDPKYHPNPDRFDPERFSDENRDKIIPGTYFPFGLGPRNCIGSRFALMQVKVMIYKTLLQFSLNVNEKTQIPIQLKASPVTLSSKDGIHLQLLPRHKI